MQVPLDIRRTRPAKSNLCEPIRETASQTAGPYVHIGCLPDFAGVNGVYSGDLIANRPLPEGEVITVSGQVFEGNGIACKDVMLEFWQADRSGSFENGVWLRTATDLETGIFTIQTVLPGSPSNETENTLAPSINVWIAARGINTGLLTRIYFPVFASLNQQDPHLRLVPQERRKTLYAQPTDVIHGWKFDVHLQGQSETVFFET